MGAFACSFNFVKILFVDVKDGAIYAFTRRPTQTLELVVPASAAVLDECDAVRLHGLVNKPDLNGARGTLGRLDREKGRWQVKMDDGSGVHLIKPENLTSLSHDQVWPPDSADGLARWFDGYVRRLEDGVYGKLP